MTRIIAGLAGGRRLLTPTGPATRPTTDRVREALFSRLEHRDLLAGARVLDLYAGSGSLGLEAASRGAVAVVLVERSSPVADVARRNAVALRPAGLTGVSVRAEPVERVLAGGPEPVGGPVDLVLADPPYDLAEDRLAEVLELLVRHGWLAPGAGVVVERSTRSAEPRWPDPLERADERRYGETRVWFAETRLPGPADVA